MRHSADDIIALLHRRIAQTSIGASALRNQGAPGVVQAARNYLAHEVDLLRFVHALPDQRRYLRFLDHHTADLLASFPKRGKSWGAARKALNLFFRDVCYNTMLAHHLGLPRSVAGLNKAMQWMEVPLDKDVAIGLRDECPGITPWPNIRSLGSDTSAEYQAAAHELATSWGIARVQLDLLFWRKI